MLALEHISMQFGGRDLFEDLSFMIGPHDRIGLVGSNGAGKSTLLKVIAGIHQADSGAISKAEYVTVGYLPQDGVIASGKTLTKEVESAFEDIQRVQEELDVVHRQLETTDPNLPEYMEIIEIFGELQHKLEDLDAFRMQSKIERVLMGLGFAVADFERQTEEFSGGWQMRIALAKLLLREPSVLLLDEPTNHLDLESLQWLEDYLHSYNGAIMLVSHDRMFLDSLTTKTFALGMGRMETYSGNYSFYETERLVRRELTMNAFRNQQKQIEHTEKFIERFRYKATKARQVQSRIKQLDKVERIEIEDEEEQIQFHFPQPQPSGVKVMELQGIVKRYGDHTVFDGLSYLIERGDRIAVVGVNGAGKSTFSRIVAGVEPISAGARVVGHNVILSYFAQHQAEELDLSKEVLEIVDDVAVGEVRKKLRSILGSFLFHGDDVFKPVKVLSGGEKSRLALAKMLLQPANVLVMDEPTNHLDMKSKKVLQEALIEYDGTYVIVSHDRSFLEPLVNKVLEVSTHGVRTYLGTVADYIQKKKDEQAAATAGAKPEAARARAAAAAAAQAPAVPDKDRKRAEAEKRQVVSKKLRPAKQRLEKIEQEIERAERRKVEIEILMADPEFYKHADKAKATAQEYKDVQAAIERHYAEWTTVTEEIAHIERSLQ
jgi:ATP-binding cassette subfamily F protein 3